MIDHFANMFLGFGLTLACISREKGKIKQRRKMNTLQTS